MNCNVELCNLANAFLTPFHSMQLKYIPLFLINSSDHDKVERQPANCEIIKKGVVETLL